MSDSVRLHRRQPTRLLRPWDSPGQNTGVGCHFLLQYMKEKSESEVTQSCPTLCDPMDCSLPGSSVHGIFQARVLEWGAIAFSQNKLEKIYLQYCIVFIYTGVFMLSAYKMNFNTCINSFGLFFLIFIYLTALGLSCGRQGLWSRLQHVGCLVLACRIFFSCSM